MQIFEMFNAIEAEFGKQTAILCVAVNYIGAGVEPIIFNMIGYETLWVDAAKEYLFDHEETDIVNALKIVKAYNRSIYEPSEKTLKEILETI